jgi:hypothetical protein
MSGPRIFVVAGMPRAGTTFLYHHLQKHPDVFMPFRKETNYFSANYARGVSWFADHFAEMQPKQIGGDINPSYFLVQESAERIAQYSPAPKVILCVRDPVEWALSLYSQVLSFDWQVNDFPEFVRGHRWKIANQRFAIRIDDGFMVRMIEHYRQTFGDHLLLYSFEAFRRDPLHILQVIESFLGLPSYFCQGNFNNRVINAANQRTNKLLRSISNSETFISIIDSFLPRALVRWARTLVDGGNKLQSKKPPRGQTLRNKQWAEEVFQSERDYVRELFSEREIQLGTGQLFPGQTFQQAENMITGGELIGVR